MWKYDEMLGEKKRYNFNTIHKSTQQHILSDSSGTILSALDMLIHLIQVYKVSAITISFFQVKTKYLLLTLCYPPPPLPHPVN